MTADGRRSSRKRGPGRPPSTDSAETRAAIFAAAARSFATNGFGDTPVSELAADAHVTSGLLYYYFGSKKGLFEAVASDAQRRLQETVIEPILSLVAPQRSLEARLTTLMNVLAHRAHEDLDLQRLLLVSTVEAEHVKEVQAFRDAAHADLLQLYKAIAGVDADGPLGAREEQLVAFVELLVLGLWYFALRPHGVDRLPILVQAVVALLDGTLFDDTSVAARNGKPAVAPRRSRDDQPEDAGIRDRIATVALHQFAKGGFGKTSLKDIAAEAGVTTGAIYYHFKSKAGLYRSAGDVGTARLAESYATTVAGLSTERRQKQRVKTYFRAIGATTHEHLDNHWIGLGVHVDAQRYPELIEARDEWGHDLKRLYRIVAEGTAVASPGKDWDTAPLPVLLNALNVGTSWTVVLHGPDALAPAIAGLESFIDGSKAGRGDGPRRRPRASSRRRT